MPTRTISPRRNSITATLEFSGLADRGVLRDESRTVVGLTVTNPHEYPIAVEIESEETKEKFGGTILAGQTVTIPTRALVMKWNPDRLDGFWDGLNIKWRIPSAG